MGDRQEEPGRPVPWRGAGAAGLVFAPDDVADPTEITVYPEHAVDDTTAWLTMDVAHVVDLDAHA